MNFHGHPSALLPSALQKIMFVSELGRVIKHMKGYNFSGLKMIPAQQFSGLIFYELVLI